MLMKKRVVIIIAAIICVLGVATICVVVNVPKAEKFVKEIVLGAIRGRVNLNTLNTGLPIIKINTKNNQPVRSKENYVNAGIEVIDPANSGNNLSTVVKIRGRGNTTWTHIKKPYRLKFSEKQAMFGFTEAKSWVLLANYQDPTLIMNAVTFELGRRFGLPYTNHAVHVDLILNGVYEGNYVLTEQIQTGEGRVDIDKDNGFLIELDNNYDEEPKFKTALLELPAMIKSPEDLSDASGYDFARDTVSIFEAALFDESFPESGYRDLIDMDTLADFILINEIVKNIELQFPRSVYMYKDAKNGSKIMMGPLWDFDYGFDFFDNGYFGDDYFNNAGGMYINTIYRDGIGRKFFNRFFEDPVFRSKYKERWNERYADIISMDTFIDKMADLLSASQKADAAVWHWWRKRNYRQEIEDMKTWWRKRTAYLNEEINKF
jgi:spore coat protein CotH